MTRLFDPGVPRIFGLPPGADFAARFLDGLMARLGDHPPEALARIEIILNTERTRRRLQSLLTNGPARLLPRLRTLTDLASDAGLALPQAQPPLARQIQLAQLVTKAIDNGAGFGNREAAFDLAGSLAELMDEMQGEGVPPDALNQIDTGDMTSYWARVTAFLRIIIDHMRATAEAPIDAQARLRFAAEQLALTWQQTPPQHPVIVAGSTGSRGATAVLMRAVAELPQGGIVLPGFDFELPDETWTSLDSRNANASDHPQAGLYALLHRLGVSPETVTPWERTPAPCPARNRLISLALRPAPVTDKWLDEGPHLLPEIAEAFAGVSLIEAPDQRAEALAIAWKMRSAYAEGKRVALVTPDRGLTRRVTAALARWSATPDDSAGTPLPQTPPGVFLRLVQAAMGPELHPGALVAILKHPICANASEEMRKAHLRHVGALELRCLRGGSPHIDWRIMAAWAGDDADRQVWIAWLQTALQPLSDVSPAPLPVWCHRHRKTAEHLAGGWQDETATGELWDKDAGKAALAAMEGFVVASDTDWQIGLSQYRGILGSVLAGEVPDSAVATHGNIAILGTLEARTQDADLVILGGLNEGSWPRLPAPDPWLNRDMRRQVGLPSPERRVGLAAHDFQQAAGAAEVVLSRSLRDEAAPTVPSRWLLRLTNLMTGLGPSADAELKAMRARGTRLQGESAEIDRPGITLAPAGRPAPCPPLGSRPQSLSVTQIETLIRDPYAIYARHILNLRKLDPLGRDPDFLLRGTLVHEILETFVRATFDRLPPDAEDRLTAVINEVLDSNVPWAASRLSWQARLEAAAPQFITQERARREIGSPALLEAQGRRSATGLSLPFDLTAKADRIDRLMDGSIAIYDYKTGDPPGVGDLQTHAVQVPLEAAIAAAGGFEGLPPVETSVMQILSVKADGKIRDIGPQGEAFWEHFVRFISHYLSPESGFPARTRPKTAFESDYDHLSRRGEWLDGDPFEVEPVT